MKKLVLVLLSVLSLTGWTQPFNGGVLVGGVISQVDGDNNGGYHKFGLLGGGFVSLRISPASSLQFEMEYIQKGARISDSLTGNTTLNRIHYLELPLLYQFTFAKRLQAEIGPAADVFLGSYNEVNGAEAPDNGISPYKTVSITGIAGLACFLTPHLKAGIRVNYSLTSSRSNFNGPYSRYILWQRGQFNNLLSLQLSWYFKER
ncbi:MAG TPA: outer membrane beta-barrel protein [Bacteroidales bacterium]|nr:outer membrane beta-barrel protein [Bacteroidales bacterium]HPS62581.1 outer membrane beta-barrel protein [Bacteroidales bacterium]